jgi:hypothetical protein
MKVHDVTSWKTVIWAVYVLHDLITWNVQHIAEKGKVYPKTGCEGGVEV